ncbi:permease [Dehalococcoides mccartyi]|jgi:hypothetical protein|uniref:Permease n=2 Tax=Dehalococcoides mccartyi TaxID=61435 RepID=A0A142VA76_9CHLR|nr:permease [Dehalococcoides mccartyi]AII61056.1 hypothetical protein X794_04385 [Dehalococcoides mccartyi CG5]AMU86736.1 permease [Dehalococcoides mccartyi]MBA2085304.1 putative membrane protein, YraQ family [Dehalococcoides mccartyi]QBX64011.1 permease [Dehalococcoides mccartyi]CAI83093.1 putative permease [Dehalococcoides mccartyi CBDB1]
MDFIFNLLAGGFSALLEYLSAHVIACLVPAFFIAGAISVFLNPAIVTKYFGSKVNPFVSYSIASVSGFILAVCSCTVLPLFAGIYKRGGGIGPAVTFLYSGPAISILAVSLSAGVLGYDIGIARAIFAIIFAILIGFIMAYLFRKDKSDTPQPLANLPADTANERPMYQTLIYFGSLVAILIFASAKNIPVFLLALLVLLFSLWRFFKMAQIKEWLSETWRFVKLIFPWLIGGIFIAGVLKTLIPAEFITTYVGSNNPVSNLIASLSGALLYFATLTEVPIVKAFMDLGMAKGPALALLLAGPAVSLPSFLVIRKILGNTKALTYIGLVILSSSMAGFIFGIF